MESTFDNRGALSGIGFEGKTIKQVKARHNDVGLPWCFEFEFEDGGECQLEAYTEKDLSEAVLICSFFPKEADDCRPNEVDEWTAITPGEVERGEKMEVRDGSNEKPTVAVRSSDWLWLAAGVVGEMSWRLGDENCGEDGDALNERMLNITRELFQKLRQKGISVTHLGVPAEIPKG